jgi:hypothetical protein
VINIIKDKNHLIISTDIEKGYKIHDKIPEESGNRRGISQYNKGYIYDEHVANIILNG